MQRIGPLDCLVHEAGEGPFSVVLFHGFGADAGDLFPLVQFLDHPRVGRWYFPNGIIAANGVPMGRAWFPIDVAAMEAAMLSGNVRDFSRMPEGLAQARAAAEEFYRELELEPQKTILGGFSQGAMLATHTALCAKQDYAGLAILSGTFLGREEWPEMAKKKSLAFFQSHGEQDPLLPFDAAEKLYGVLKEAGWSGEFLAFPGGHEIPVPALMGLKSFLDKTVSN